MTRCMELTAKQVADLQRETWAMCVIIQDVIYQRVYENMLLFYNTLFFSSMCRIDTNFSKYIMQFNGGKKAEKEAATRYNKINRNGKSIAPLPAIKDFPYWRERKGLLLKLKFLCSSSNSRADVTLLIRQRCLRASSTSEHWSLILLKISLLQLVRCPCAVIKSMQDIAYIAYAHYVISDPWLSHVLQLHPVQNCI